VIHGATDHLTELTELVRLGGTPRPDLLDRLARLLDVPVRSVSEDRAVATARSRRLRAQSQRVRNRASLAQERAETINAVADELFTVARAILAVAGSTLDGAQGVIAAEATMRETLTRVRAQAERRASTHRAVGMVMATRFCDAAQAGQYLVGTTQRTNRKVRDIAGLMAAYLAAGHRLPRQLSSLHSLATGATRPPVRPVQLNWTVGNGHGWDGP
jgi:Asp/Glu/hydantoin racemase